MSLAAGTRIGPFEVGSPLGEGGMGIVYRALDTQLQRDVALKLLPDNFAKDPDRLARFQREAQVLASLNHPNIAQIYGLEGTDASRCIVMELVEGETLQERLKRGPIPVDEALPIAKQIAEALEAAHEKGITHRDLKPGNIKSTPDGRIKVLDFGLAKMREASGPAASMSNSPTLLAASMPGVIMGTAAYMSPEQAKGRPIDRRTDIFAFGCVLYEMLTGRPAFDGEDVAEILSKVLQRDPDWTSLPANVPPRIRELLRLCLQKDVRKRRSDAADVRIDIEQALSEPAEIAALPAASRPRERLAWIIAAVFLIGLAALAPAALRHFRESPPDSPMIRSSILPLENTTFDFQNGVGLPTLSPDGRRIAFGARTAGGMTPLWVRSLDGLDAHPLAGTEGATFPFWSPDSRFIAFFADGKLKKIDASGGPVLTVTDAPLGRGGTWSRNGVIVFAPNNNPDLMWVSSAGGTANPIPSIQGSVPWFLPDGQHFLYQDLPGSGAATPEMPFRVGSVDGSQSKVLGSGSNVLYAQGHFLFLHEGTLMAQPFDAERLATAGEAVPIAEHVQTVLASGRVGVFSVSETGLLVYRSGANQRNQLTWFDRAGKAMSTVGGPDENTLLNPALSPDGRRAAVDRSVQGNQDIWLIDLLRGGATRVTFDAASDRAPAWSFDGAQIVFSSNRKNVYDLYTKPSSGAGAEQLLLKSPNPKVPYGWSADGRFLLYGESTPKTVVDVWALPMQGDRKPLPVATSPFDERNGQFSPDGRWVAYHSNESSRFEIYVVPFPAGGGKWQVSKDGGISPRWRHDGKELFFIAPDGQMMAANISASGASFEAAPPAALFQTHITGGGGNFANQAQYAVSADSRFLINVAVGPTLSPLTLIQNWKTKP